VRREVCMKWSHSHTMVLAGMLCSGMLSPLRELPSLPGFRPLQGDILQHVTTHWQQSWWQQSRNYGQSPHSSSRLCHKAQPQQAIFRYRNGHRM
jgi:hypothetical protein